MCSYVIPAAVTTSSTATTASVTDGTGNDILLAWLLCKIHRYTTLEREKS